MGRDRVQAGASFGGYLTNWIATPTDSPRSCRTPMLVTHGDEDNRVPIAEAMRLWWDLSSRARPALVD